ncbi:O-acetyltransferase OatA [compost metagenome]
MAALKYRPEIDGLRAIAVLSVFLFHLEAAWLPGGFAGVDVFFVLSGFLITGILGQDITSSNFSPKVFYTRRIKRILPPLYLVLLITILAGSAILLDNDYVYLSNSVTKILLFISNIFFYQTGDYFAPLANETPLLHTWSLAVEEQFYFFWPLLLIVLFRFRPSIRIYLLFAFTLSSFLVGEFFLRIHVNKSFAYYSIFTRMGELSIGGLLAFKLQQSPLQQSQEIIKRISQFLSLLGLSFILCSFIFLNERSLFPGLNALPVTMGTALTLWSMQLNERDILKKFLSNPYLVYVGKISYSLYLWHWPILAFMRYVRGSYQLPLTWIFVAIIATFTFATLSYRFVECWAKKSHLSFQSSFLCILVLPGLFIYAIGKTPIWLGTPDKQKKIYLTYGGDEICHGKIADCIKGDPNKTPQFLVFGDSHAAHYNYFIDKLGRSEGWSAKFITASSCGPAFEYDYKRLPNWAQKSCSELLSYARHHFKKYKAVIIGGRWDFQLGLNNDIQSDPEFLSKFILTLKEITSSGTQVFILSQIPILTNSPLRFEKAKNLHIPVDLNEAPQAAIANKIIQSAVNKIQNVIWVDTATPIRKMSHGIFLHGKLIYMDNNHLNQYGASALAEEFKETFSIRAN